MGFVSINIGCSGKKGTSLISSITDLVDETDQGQQKETKVLYERSLTSNDAILAKTSDNRFAISLAANSFENQSKLSITRYPKPESNVELNENFRFASNLYGVSFIDETANILLPNLMFSVGQITQPRVNFLTEPATITIQLANLPDAGAEYYIAISTKRNEWTLATIPQSSNTEFSYATNYINAIFAIVERIDTFDGMVEGTMSFNSSLNEITVSENEIIEKDVDISLNIPLKDSLELNHSNSDILFNLSTKNPFSFVIGNPENKIASLTLSASAPTANEYYKSQNFKGLDYCKVEKTGNNTTLTFRLGLKGWHINDLPPAITIMAAYKNTIGLTYTAEHMIHFRKGERLAVDSIVPEEKSIILPRTQSFTIKFNRDMDQKAASMTISLQEYGKSETTALEHIDWAGVRTLLASTSSQLEFSADYHLVISNAMTSDGAMHSSPFKFLYKTASQTSDIIMIRPSISEEVGVNTDIAFDFDYLQTDTLIAENFKLFENDEETEIILEVINATSKFLQLKPNVPLNHDKEYYVCISSDVLDKTGSPIETYRSPTFTTISRPCIVEGSITPNISEEIPVNSLFTVEFCRKMDEASIELEGAVNLKKVGGESVALRLTWENNHEKLIIKPMDFLTPGADYELIFSEKIRDHLTNKIATKTFVFTTSEKATIIELTPDLSEIEIAESIATNTKFIAKFSKEIASFEPKDVVDLRNLTTGLSIPCSIEINGETVSIIPNNAMAHETEYRLHIKDTATDKSGVEIIPYMATFTTAIKPIISATNLTPSGNFVNHEFEITFNKAMNKDKTEAAFSMQPSKGDQWDEAIDGNFSWLDDDKKLSFTPSEDLEFLKDYRLRIDDSACDTDLNAIDEYLYRFRTTSQTVVSIATTTLGSLQGTTRTVATSTAFVFEFTRKINENAEDLANKINFNKNNSGNSLVKNLQWEDVEQKKLVVTPEDPLIYGETYSIELNNIIDEHGQKVAPYEIIRTADVRPKVVLETEVWQAYKPNIWPSDKLRLKFTKEMNRDTVESALSITTIESNSLNFEWSDDKTVTVSIPWKAQETYTVKLENSARDKFGNSIEDNITKEVKVIEAAKFNEFKVTGISNSFCHVSYSITKDNSPGYEEVGVSWHIKDNAEIATYSFESTAYTFSKKKIEGFTASTTYLIRPYVIYKDNFDGLYTELGTEKEFSTNPLGGGKEINDKNYLVSTEDNSYEISTPKELMIIGQHERAPLDGFYKQTAHIDMFHDALNANLDTYDSLYDKTEGFKPIGTYDNPFTGVYNGDDKKIIALNVLRSDEDNVGLFGCIKDAKLKNIKMVDALIEGRGNCGSLVGQVLEGEKSTIKNCSAMVQDNTVDSGVYATQSYVGGILGKGAEGTEIIGTEFSGRIIANPKEADVEYYGGIAGYMGKSSKIESCHVSPKYNEEDQFTGTEINTVSAAHFLNKSGGIVGACDDGTTIENCIAEIELNAGNDNQTAGGIVGVATSTEIIKCKTKGTVAAKHPGSIAGETIGGSIEGCETNTDVSQSEQDHSCLVYTVKENTDIKSKDDYDEDVRNICTFKDPHTCHYRLDNP